MAFYCVTVFKLLSLSFTMQICHAIIKTNLDSLRGENYMANIEYIQRDYF